MMQDDTGQLLPAGIPVDGDAPPSPGSDFSVSAGSISESMASAGPEDSLGPGDARDSETIQFHGFENLFAELGLLDEEDDLFDPDLPEAPGKKKHRPPTFYHYIRDAPGLDWLLSEDQSILVRP